MENEAKEQIMKRLTNVLQGQGTIIREDTITSAEDKLTQMDVVLDVLHFLKDYDENVAVLNKYWLDKRHREKFGMERDD